MEEIKMPVPFTFTTFLFSLVLTLFFNNVIAKQGNPSSLVLGLSHSRNVIPIPKLYSSNKRPSKEVHLQYLMEPLRESRDGYLISLSLGTPPQVIQVYMDTGSDLTWFPCGNLTFDCMGCEDYRNSVILKTTSFSPSYSSSSSRDLCASSFCIDIHSSDNSYDPCTIAGCSLSTLLKGTCSRPCPSFSYTYGEGRVVVGTLTRDTLRVHGSVPREFPNFCFGSVGSTYKEPVGIAGFGRGALSFPSQLGFLHNSFSHCFLPFKFANNPNISSPLVVGGDLANGLHFTPMLKSPMYPNYYYIGLEAITVGNVSAAAVVPLSLREFDSQGNGGMLIDSGTTYTHLPEPFYSQLLSVLRSLIPYPRASEVETRTGFDLCYKVPCPNNTAASSTDDLPSITFHFLNNVSLVLPKGNHFYVMAAPSNFTAVKCLLFQSMDINDEDNLYGPAGVFGSFQQQNVEVVYDLENERIGFQTTDCALASASQGLHKN